MSVNRRRRRLEALERRQIRGPSWADPFPAAIRLLAAFECERAATKAGRLFSPVPRPEPKPVEPGERDHLAEAMRLYDGMAAKFEEQRKAVQLAKQEAKRQRCAARRAARAAEPAPSMGSKSNPRQWPRQPVLLSPRHHRAR
jgi:hypothetical protein